MDYPNTLYKYKAFPSLVGLDSHERQKAMLARERVFENLRGKIWLSKPDSLNDAIFELDSIYTPAYPHDPEKNIQYEMAEIKRIYDRALKEGRYSREQYEYLCSKLRVTVLANMENNYRDAIADIREHTGVFCLSAAQDTLPMWSHYADEHRGIVLHYRTNHRYFQRFNTLRKIEYRNTRPIFTLNPSSDEWPKEYLETMVFTKHESWAYEKEFRIQVPIGRQHVIQLIEKASFLLNGQELTLNQDIVSGVTLGIRLAEDAKTALLEFKEKEFPSLQVFRAKNNGRYGIEFQPVL